VREGEQVVENDSRLPLFFYDIVLVDEKYFK
jgi:hypothetical protein